MKIIKFLLILFLVGIIPLACCSNQDGPYEIDAFGIFLQKNTTETKFGDFLTEDDIYKEDTLKIYLEFSFRLLSQTRPALSLVPSAMATSCPDAYFENLKDKISKIEISSDTIFNNIAAGNSLNSKVRSYNPISQSFAGVDELRQIFNTRSGQGVFSYGVQHLYIIEKPISRQRHKIRVTIDYESGKQQVAETPRIYWQ